MKTGIGPCACCGKHSVRLSRVEALYTYDCETCHLRIESWTWQEFVLSILTVANTEVPA
jgi:hypothetical protein